jgi:hypothetical protein
MTRKVTMKLENAFIRFNNEPTRDEENKAIADSLYRTQFYWLNTGMCLINIKVIKSRQEVRFEADAFMIPRFIAKHRMKNLKRINHGRTDNF